MGFLLGWMNLDGRTRVRKKGLWHLDGLWGVGLFLIALGAEEFCLFSSFFFFSIWLVASRGIS